LALICTAVAPAQARVSCGTETARSSGQIFRVVGGGVGCRTAKAVAGAWFDATSNDKSGRVVADQLRKNWTCRVTERATGTDPGYNPYTSVRCTRHRAVVRFQQRS
jgi:hypothetical protein